MKIGGNFFFYFCSYVKINGTIGFSVKKIHKPGIFKSDFRQNGAAGNAKNVFPGGWARDQNTVLALQATPYITKTFWNAPGLCIFWRLFGWYHLFWSICRNNKDAGIFHLCVWFKTSLECGKSPITPSFLHIDRNKWYHSIQRNRIHSPDVFKSISRIIFVIIRPEIVFNP